MVFPLDNNRCDNEIRGDLKGADAILNNGFKPLELA